MNLDPPEHIAKQDGRIDVDLRLKINGLYDRDSVNNGIPIFL